MVEVETALHAPQHLVLEYWGSLIKLNSVRKFKILRKLVIQTHDNNFAEELILRKK